MSLFPKPFGTVIQQFIYTKREGLRLAWALLFFSSAWLAGCQDPARAGLNILPTGDRDGVYLVDTFSVEMGTYYFDSTVTSRTGYGVLGQYADPQLGVFRAIPHLEIRSQGTSVSLPSDMSCDSLIIAIPFFEFYGDTTQPMEFEVLQLADSLGDRTYFSHDNEPLRPTVLGTVSVKPEWDDARSIRFNLKSLGDQIVALGASVITDGDRFRQEIDGIALRPTRTGATVSFDLAASNGISATLYYRDRTNNNAPGTYSLLINGTCNHFTKIEADWSGTPLAGLSSSNKYIPASQTGNRTFVQAGSSLRTFLRFPGLTSFRQRLGDRAVMTRAEIWLEPIEKTPLAQSRFVFLTESTPEKKIRRDAQNLERIIFNDDTRGTSSETYIFSYNSSKERYILNITNYADRVFRGEIDNPGMFLGNASAAISSTRAVIPARLNGDTRVSLKVYYLKLD